MSPMKAWETALDFHRSPYKAQNQAYVNGSFINIRKTTPKHMSDGNGSDVCLLPAPVEEF